MWWYEFRYEGPTSLKFISLLQSRTEFNFLLLKGIILTNYFEITRKLKWKGDREIWQLMGTITKLHIAVPIVTMVTVKVGRETNIPVTLMHGRRKVKLI